MLAHRRCLSELDSDNNWLRLVDITTAKEEDGGSARMPSVMQQTIAGTTED